MTIRTNLSWNTLARYSAMLWNNGEDEYIATGDNLIEIIDAEDDPDFVLTADFLQSDCKWHIEKQFTMLDEDFAGMYHQDYLEGNRDEKTVAGHKEYLKQRKAINAFKHQYNEWLSTIEEVPEWTYDTDTDEFITFTPESNSKAVAVLH